MVQALRALRPVVGGPRRPVAHVALTRRFRDEHEAIWADIDEVRAAADALGAGPATEAVTRARHAYVLLTSQVEPHENAEEAELYPMVSRMLGGGDPTATMSRAHAEITYQISAVWLASSVLATEEPTRLTSPTCAACSTGSMPSCWLHTTQEEETYLSLGDGSDAPPVSTVAR